MLTLIPNEEEKFLNSSILELAREQKEVGGRITMLVPSLRLKRVLQRELAHDFGLNVEVSLQNDWLQNAWDLFGDGRKLMGASARAMLLRKLMSEVPYDMTPTQGSLNFMAELCSRGVESVRVGDSDSKRELEIDSLLAAYRAELDCYGRIETNDALALLSEQFILDTQRESFIFVGFERLDSALEELIRTLAVSRDCYFALRADCCAACENAERIQECLQKLSEELSFAFMVNSSASKTQAHTDTSAELTALSARIFQNEVSEKLMPRGDVCLAFPTGPSAEAEAIFREAHALLTEGCEKVLVVHPDAPRIWRDLAPKLFAASLAGECDYSVPITSTPQAAAFLALSTSVNELLAAASQEQDASLSEEFAISWDDPRDDLDTFREQTLGRALSWWPPILLSDFLLNEISGVKPARAWKLDKKWRENRALTASQVLEQLQDECLTSSACADATQELLNGNVKAALEAFKQGLEHESSAHYVLAKLVRLAEAMQEDMGSFNYRLSAKETLELFADLCSSQRITEHLATREDEPASIIVTDPTRARGLDGRSYDAVIYLGLDTINSPIPTSDGALAMLLERLGKEPVHDKLLDAELAFSRIIMVAKKKLVVGSSIFDSAANKSYPALGLLELRSCYGAPDNSAQDALEGYTHIYEENRLRETFSRSVREADGSARAPLTEQVFTRGLQSEVESSHGQIIERLLMFTSDGDPILSPTSLEAYLDCPRKWLVTRLLTSERVDRGFGALEFGSFSHDVLQALYSELISCGARVEERTFVKVEKLLQEFFTKKLKAQLHAGELGNPLISRSSANDDELSNLYLDLREYLENEQTHFEGFRPLACEYEFGKENSALPDFSFAGARFRGKIDRIDVDDENKQLIVIDYKRGGNNFMKSYSLREDIYTNEDGPKPYDYDLPNKIQALVYAAALKQMAKRGVGALEGRRDYQVAASLYVAVSPAERRTQAKKSRYQMTGAVGEKELDERLWGKPPHHTVKKRIHPFDVGLKNFDDLLAKSEDHIRSKIEMLTCGEFDAKPRTEYACVYCPLNTSCSKRMT